MQLNQLQTARIYVNGSCSSSRKASAYFTEKNLPYRKISFREETILEEDLDRLMTESNTGFEDLIKENRLKEVLDISAKECKQLIMEQPSILKTPIVIQGRV
ncbi:ArsC/Spx/MgsR family protein [Priestia filamentosa]|uniref:ArsC/Spx/MgsR family protein n=1 Tax=Priestia filamentosa TaxID=1402861 RepID=UPI003982C764